MLSDGSLSVWKNDNKLVKVCIFIERFQSKWWGGVYWPQVTTLEADRQSSLETDIKVCICVLYMVCEQIGLWTQ